MATQIPEELEAVLLTRSDVCERLRISARTLDRIVTRGELRPVRAGRRPRFERADLERYLARPQEGATPEATPLVARPSELYVELAEFARRRGWWLTDEAVAQAFAEGERLRGCSLTSAERSSLHRILEAARAREWGEAS